MGFFILFVLAPVFDIFRYDLDADHAWLLGMEWRLGLDPFRGLCLGLRHGTRLDRFRSHRNHGQDP